MPAILDCIPELVTSSARISVFWEEGVFLPGDTVPFYTGVLTLSRPPWAVIPATALSAALGDQVGYTIGRTMGRRVFERRDSALVSRSSLTRTQAIVEVSAAVGILHGFHARSGRS